MHVGTPRGTPGAQATLFPVPLAQIGRSARPAQYKSQTLDVTCLRLRNIFARS
jgi:hypothetical protein